MENQEEHQNDFLKAYDLYSDAIFRYCFFRLGDREKALELTQDTFMKTWKYMIDSGNISNIRAFLYRIAGNIVIDEYRKRRPQDSLEVLLEESGFEPASDDYEHIVDQLDGERAILLLSQIPELYKEVLYMKYVDNLTLSEIGDITGEEENTIAVRIHRGIAKLNKIVLP